MADKELGGHGILSCLGVIVRPGVAIVVVLLPMPRRDAAVPAVMALLVWWWLANCFVRHGPYHLLLSFWWHRGDSEGAGSRSQVVGRLPGAWRCEP